MKSDYRNTIYEVSKKDIINEKNALEDKIKKEHPKVKIIYNQINKKDGNYNKQFRNIYNNKCAYCGISTDVISSELFEIDHFICEISFNGDSINAGKINNLVLSCKKCNRAKKDFIWNEIYSLKFNVDDESITELFYRDVDYSIKIEKEYITDNSIYNFYIKLKLNEDKNIYRILEYIVLLQKKRNEL